jgi:hypothetical protein
LERKIIGDGATFEKGVANKNDRRCNLVRVCVRVQTQTMTIYSEAKLNLTMTPNWPKNRSPGEFGTAVRSILKMLRNAMPNSLGHRFQSHLGSIFRVVLSSVYMVGVCVCTLFIHPARPKAVACQAGMIRGEGEGSTWPFPSTSHPGLTQGPPKGKFKHMILMKTLNPGQTSST